jgi:hypothetical protein
MNSYTLVFQRNQETLPENTPIIRIRATGSPKWNDFLFNFQAVIEVFPNDGRLPFSVPAYVMPTSSSDSAKRLDSWVSSQESPRNITLPEGRIPDLDQSGLPAFISLLDGEQHYGQLASWSSSEEERYAVLGAINDITYLRGGNVIDPDILSPLTLRESFTLGVLRTPSAYRALHRGWRRVQARPIPPLNDARRNFCFSTKLRGFSDSHRLSIDFLDSHVFEDRIHTLIGVNGCGKTRMLRELILSLGDRFTRLEGTQVFLDSFDSEAESSRDNEYEGQDYSRVLVFSVDSETRYPPATRTDTPFEYQYFNLVRDPLSRDRSDDLDGSGIGVIPVTMARLLVDILRSNDEIGIQNGSSLKRLAVLKRALGDHVNLDQLYVPLLPCASDTGTSFIVADNDGSLWVSISDLSSLNEQRQLELTAMLDEHAEAAFFSFSTTVNTLGPKIPLSSGQKIFFNFAVRFVGVIDKGTLVLIDEPETHLHPNLVCDFMTLLYEVLGPTYSAALIATHSAYVVREVPTHCVHVFSHAEDSNRVEIGHVRLRTLGASIDTLSQAVFGDATVKKFHEKLAKEISKTEQSVEEVLLKYEAVLSPEMLIQIRAEMDGGEGS